MTTDAEPTEEEREDAYAEAARVEQLQANGNRFAGQFDEHELTALMIGLTMETAAMSMEGSRREASPEERLSISRAMLVVSGLMVEVGNASDVDASELVQANHELHGHIAELMALIEVGDQPRSKLWTPE